MKSPPNKRKIQAEETKARILKTANQMFLEKGVKNVSVRELCRDCGITNGAFYHHFESKDDIILRLCLEDFDEYIISQLFNGEEKFDPLNLISKYIFYSSEYFHVSGPEIVKEAYKIVVATESKTLDYMSQKHLSTLKDIIVRGQQEGKIRTDITAEAIFVFVVSLATGILFDWNIIKKDYRANVIGEKEISKLLESLRPV
jgi:TetR/AcrR family transcriptional regulator, fatty acid metabolism regulator protein